ncbi:hypothetical protein C8R43DRAFT_1110921 [Mycena crocata]|nr:hypothetical protein C8R43DRAFT_1110921 [Mycena crocata]
MDKTMCNGIRAATGSTCRAEGQGVFRVSVAFLISFLSLKPTFPPLIIPLHGTVDAKRSEQGAGSTNTSDSAAPRVQPPTSEQPEITYFTESLPEGGSSALNSPSPFFEMTSPAMVPEEEEQDEEHLEHIRKIFLAHRFQVGFSIPDETLEVFTQGVIEGANLQPEVLHACQLMGSLLARHLRTNTWLPLPGQSKAEAKQLRLTLFFLQNTVPVPLPHLQATILLSLHFSIKGELLRAQEVLATANKIVMELKLDAALLQPPNATPESLSKRTITPVPTTPTAEIQAALSHLVYLDISHMIFSKLPSVVDPELYATFKRIATIPAADAEIHFVRVKSTVLMFEAQKLGEHWPATWHKKYWELMEAIETHRCVINLALTRTVFCPELKIVWLTLKMCSIIVLTGLSILLALFSPHHVELKRKQHDVVAEIVSISASYSEEDCEYLDPMVSAEVFNNQDSSANTCCEEENECQEQTVGNQPSTPAFLDISFSSTVRPFFQRIVAFPTYRARSRTGSRFAQTAVSRGTRRSQDIFQTETELQACVAHPGDNVSSPV